MNNTISSILKDMPVEADPVRLRYSFDHLVKAVEPDEENSAVFYITTGGKAYYVKQINGELVLKNMTFLDPKPEDTHAIALLDAIAINLYDVFISRLPADIPMVTLTTGIQGVLSAATTYTREVRPDLDVRVVNATGLFKDAYPSTEEIIDTLTVLEKKMLAAEQTL